MSNRPESPGSQLPEPKDEGFLDAIAGGADDRLTGHCYDGIQEYDNPLPGWWKWIFIATILFCFPYIAFYHSGAEGRSLEDRYAAASAANARLQFADIGELDGDATTLVKYMNDPSWLRVGESVFKANCTSCHGALGEGLVGPNLRNEVYKNVRTIEDIYDVVSNGAAAGAMPAWKDRLEQNERVLVAAYVASLRGTETGEGKAPEGQPIAPWPEYEEPEEEEPAGEEVEGEPTEESDTPSD